MARAPRFELRRLANVNLVRSRVEVIVVGIASAGGGYLLGSVPGMLGL